MQRSMRTVWLNTAHNIATENGFSLFKTVQVDTPGTYDEFHFTEKQLSVAILITYIFYETRQIQLNRHGGHLS